MHRQPSGARRAASLFALFSSLLLALPPRTASAICRVIEHGASAPVAFDPTTAAFFVLAPDVIIGWTCPPGGPEPEPADAGASADAAVDLDGGTPDDAGTHDGAIADAGTTDLDAGSPDAGAVDIDGTPLCWDGSRATAIRDSVVSLVVQPRLLDGGGRAALVMPVPAHPQVVVGEHDIFADVRSASGNTVHEIVEVTEDRALGFQCTDPHYSALDREARETEALELAALVAAAPAAVFGCALDSAYYSADAGPRPTTIYRPDGGSLDSAVIVESIPTTEDYDVHVLAATDLAVLGSWLDENGFPHDEDDDAALSAYLGEDHYFIALEVHPAEGEGLRDLAPLVVSWLGESIPVTHRLQYDPHGGVLVTDSWVLAPHRMDANDESAITESSDHLVLVPRTLTGFGLRRGYLTHLRISRHQRDDVPDAELVAVDDVELAGTLERTTRVRIPLACCPLGIVAPASGPERVRRFERSYPVNESPAIPEAWLRSSLDADAPYCAAERDASGGWSGGGSTGSGSSGSSGGYGCGGGSTPPSRPSSSLRGCAAPTQHHASVFFSWLPIGLALFWIWRRSRR